MTIEDYKEILRKVENYKNDEDPMDLYHRLEDLELFILRKLEKLIYDSKT